VARTAANKLYENDSPGAKVTASFGIEFARKALGYGCVHMLKLFPDTELAIDQIVVAALKSSYTPTPPQMDSGRVLQPEPDSSSPNGNQQLPQKRSTANRRVNRSKVKKGSK
jgi:hypothetical protein